MKKYFAVALLLAVITPLFASAYLGGVKDLIKAAGDIVQLLTVLAAAVALLVFFWGLAQFIMKAGGKDASEGKNIMKWGLLSLFVMMSVWGIVGFFQKEFGLPVTAPGQTPNSQNINTNITLPCSSEQATLPGTDIPDPRSKPCL